MTTANEFYWRTDNEYYSPVQALRKGSFLAINRTKGTINFLYSLPPAEYDEDRYYAKLTAKKIINQIKENCNKFDFKVKEEEGFSAIDYCDDFRAVIRLDRPLTKAEAEKLGNSLAPVLAEG